jgi:hypothetical protein
MQMITCVIVQIKNETMNFEAENISEEKKLNYSVKKLLHNTKV